MQAVEKISVVQQVEKGIKDYILNEEVQIGDKLPSEKVLCEELQVGRGTVREAIRLLQAKGYVEIVTGRGAFVISKEEAGTKGLVQWFRENEIELKDFIEVRMAIEPLATRLAIQRCTDYALQKMREIHTRSVIAAKNNDAAELALCDEQFHTCIVENSYNKLLYSINKQILKGLIKFRSKTFLIPTNVQNFIPAHFAILEAFEKRDMELGGRKMMEHLESVYVDLENSKNVDEADI